MGDLYPVTPYVIAKLPGSGEYGRLNKRTYRQTNKGNLRGFNFGQTHAFGAQTANMGFEAITIQKTGRFRELTLCAADPECTDHQ